MGELETSWWSSKIHEEVISWGLLQRGVYIEDFTLLCH